MQKLTIFILIIAFAIGILVYSKSGKQTDYSVQKQQKETPVAVGDHKNGMKIRSSVFTEGSSIPQKYTCDGEDVSPPLKFEDVVGEAKSLVLIVDDPDAPVGLWTHWVLYNLDPQTTEIPEGKTFPNDQQASTSSGKQGYGGPCPPLGTHRYFFRLYALDTKLSLNNPDRKKIDEALEGHVLSKAELMGTYKRSNQ